MTAGTDTGISDSDNQTNNTAPAFTGIAEANSSLTLTSSVSGNIGTATVDGSGNWSVTASTLAQGPHNITVATTDLAGNSSIASSQLPINIDNVDPLAPSAPDMTAASDSGVSNSDNATNYITPTFTGTAEANCTVDLTSSTAGNVGSVLSDGSGNWTITCSAMAGGIHNMTAIATDIAGNISVASSATQITIDTEAPVFDNFPDNMTVRTVTKTDTSARVSWSEPTANDNVTGTVIPVQTVGPANNTDFPLGITTITYTASDGQGNSTNESFLVNVTQKFFPWLDFIPGLISPNKSPGSQNNN